MSGERLYDDKYTRGSQAEEPENLKQIEALQSLRSDLQVQKTTVEPTRLQRKFKRIFGTAGNASQLFLTGFKMGFIVGGTFGGVIGCYQFYQMRQFAIIPLSIIGTGCSFGTFMGAGMTLRSGDM